MVSWDWGYGTIGPEELAAPLGPMKNPLRTRMFAWWYFTIAGGFLLLGD